MHISEYKTRLKMPWPMKLTLVVLLAWAAKWWLMHPHGIVALGWTATIWLWATAAVTVYAWDRIRRSHPVLIERLGPGDFITTPEGRRKELFEYLRTFTL